VEHSDTLLTLAEIAIALAGFTGIVGVLGRGTQDPTRAISWLRLRTMLEVSLRNAAFAVLPIPFLALVSSETIVWRVASGAYFVAVVAYAMLRRRSESPTTVGPALTRPFIVLLPVSLLACIANVLGLGGSNAFSLYLLSLVLGLVTAGMLFLSVAATFFNDGGE